MLHLNFRAHASMHALPECSAALSVKLGKRPDQKREGEFSTTDMSKQANTHRGARAHDHKDKGLALC